MSSYGSPIDPFAHPPRKHRSSPEAHERAPEVTAETTGSDLIDRLAEGPSVWGSFSAGSGRYGVCRYRLVVFPPGISSTQRRRLRLWRGWPIWGACLWLAAALGLGAIGTPAVAALCAATALFVISGVIARRIAGHLPGEVRTIDLTTIPGYDLPEGTPTPASIADTLGELRCADARMSRGIITPVEHEVIWQHVYDSMPHRRSRWSRRRPFRTARR